MVYALAVLTVTLYPFRFQEPRRLRDLRAEGAEWSRTDGMVFDATGMFSFDHPSPEIRSAIAKAGTFHVYLEARPEGVPSAGPRRLLAYEAPTRTAFSLNQQGNGLLLRITGSKGSVSDHLLPRAFAPGQWSRLLVHVAADSIRFWHNGERREAVPAAAFDPASWTRNAWWIAGNDTHGELGWRGKIRRASVAVGAPPLEWQTAAAPPPALTPLFELSTADGVYPRDWYAHKTDALGRTARDPWSLIPFSEPIDRAWARVDWVLNLLLLVPFGVLLLLAGAHVSRATLAGFGLSLLIEGAQVFIPVRHTQSTDLVLNTAGALLGALVAQEATRWIRAVVRAPSLKHSSDE